MNFSSRVIHNYLSIFGSGKQRVCYRADSLEDTAPTVIVFYDWFLTLREEVQYAWLVPKTWGVWLFLLNRYFALITVSTHRPITSRNLPGVSYTSRT